MFAVAIFASVHVYSPEYYFLNPDDGQSFCCYWGKIKTDILSLSAENNILYKHLIVLTYFYKITPLDYFSLLCIQLQYDCN